MAYHGVARLIHVDWVVSHWVGRFVYETTVASIVTYAASAFEQKLRMFRRFAESPRAAQEPALLAICKA